MKKIIIIIFFIVVIGVGFLVYNLFLQKNNQTNQSSLNRSVNSSLTSNTTSSQVLVSSQNTSTTSVFGDVPMTSQLTIGTPSGAVEVNNFYLLNPPVDDGGNIILKQTQNYIIVYDPIASNFWLGISGNPFATWEQLAEKDFLSTLGVSSSDACKLNITSGVIYSRGNPLDGEILPVHFCGTTGAFQSQGK